MPLLIHSHPRLAPFVAGIAAMVLSLALSWPLGERLLSKLAQAAVLGIVVFLALRHVAGLEQRDGRRE